jgi:hypothetical protein
MPISRSEWHRIAQNHGKQGKVRTAPIGMPRPIPDRFIPYFFAEKGGIRLDAKVK